MKQNVLRYCCLFSIWTTRKMHDFQGYFSRTFQDQSDFPGLSKSWNFQEKIQDFPGGVATLFYRPDALPVAQTTVSKHWRENITFHGLAYPKLTWGLPALSLTTSSSYHHHHFDIRPRGSIEQNRIPNTQINRNTEHSLIYLSTTHPIKDYKNL